MLNSADHEVYLAHMLKCQQLLIFISRINSWFCRFKPKFSNDLGYFSIYDKFKFHAQLRFITLGPDLLALYFALTFY